MTTARPALYPDDYPPSPQDKEARLQQIRREAEESANRGAAPAHSDAISQLHGPFDIEPSYHGRPLLKSPVWTEEIPIYFFVGGAAGASAIISALASRTGQDEALIRDARWIAAIGGAISPALLISDLGYPRRFLNMMRVFKPQSPMSVGSWTLAAFSSSTAAAAFFATVQKHPRKLLRVFTNAADMIGAITGAALATYTGVLIGATVVPVWHSNVGILPIHFAASALSSATSLLELRGHESPALNAIGIAACAGETLIGASIELDSRRANDPLRKGKTGWLTRLGGVLSGPVPLVLRILASTTSDEKRSVRLRRAAALSSIAGSLVTRKAWISAGKVSVKDPQLEMAENPNQLSSGEKRAPALEVENQKNSTQAAD